MECVNYRMLIDIEKVKKLYNIDINVDDTDILIKVTNGKMNEPMIRPSYINEITNFKECEINA